MPLLQRESAFHLWNKVGGTWSKLTPNAQHSWKCEEIFGRKSNWNRFCTNEIASSAASFDPIGPAAPQLIQPCFTWDILRHLETSSNIHISLTRSTKPSAKEAKNTGTDLAIRPPGAASAEKNCCPLSHLWDFLVPCQVLNPTSSNALAKVTLKPTHFWPKNAAVIMLHQEESTSSRQLALGILQWCLSFERFVLDCWDSLLNYLVISLVYIGALAAMTVFAWRVATHRLTMLSLVRSQSPLPTRLTVCP